jgi:hypothetical protein
MSVLPDKRKGRCPAPPYSKGTLHRSGLALDNAATRFARGSSEGHPSRSGSSLNWKMLPETLTQYTVNDF